MHTLLQLTAANLRSYVRDRAALFWTIAFPLVFVILFGAIFQGGSGTYAVGWVDQDGTPQSIKLHDNPAFAALFKLTDGTEDDLVARMRGGDLRAVIVVPKGYGAAADAATPGSAPAAHLTLYTDPSQQQTALAIDGIVRQAVSVPLVGIDQRTIQTTQISQTAYIVPSILAMALMQLGLFGAIPIVEQRQQLILKRLGATPLKRWMLVGSNLITRVLLGVLQAVLILGVGNFLFGITVLGSPIVLAFLVVLGAVMFISLGYLVASFAPTEDSASQITSLLQFPLMFLSGIFFPIELLPPFLKVIAALLPLTYLGDALRQVMVGGSPFVPISLSVAVLGVWTIVCFGISARYFRWQ